jgi:hypothetical protein
MLVGVIFLGGGRFLQVDTFTARRYSQSDLGVDSLEVSSGRGPPDNKQSQLAAGCDGPADG